MATTLSRSGILAGIMLACGALAVTLPAASVSASPLDWFSGSRIKGSGNLQKQTREPGHFSALALGVPGKLELRFGNTESVTIETDDNIQSQIDTAVENGVLRIRSAKRNSNFSPTALRIVVQAKNIDRITVGGSGSIHAEVLRAPRLKVEVGGSGSVDVGQLDSESLSVSIGGSGNFKAAGRSNDFSVAIGGSGSVSAGRLEARTVNISIGGSGETTVWARQALDISIGGSGDVSYYGAPRLSQSTHGSGRVRKLGEAPN
ncbi:head GIN domain-containing protein [Janthinobacterium agaricidamnosum]|uniref:Uncharacterized domain protein n=1 Tax=Janthinobacterium agaricidamnosum NBRC 102515 = DSM 9628 TaxID=1349767 RepID=W0V395_9BURK|nr:head GIN domain-containing protein [Janthinobacterium agaricidamnosum]CDG82055.1 putative uncharacterized domain protein [Janthinobacterium agaricidamnosum NBRC 102515 = DSM 9628]